MALFSRNKKETAPVQEERGLFCCEGLSFNGSTFYSTSKAMQLSAVNAAVNQISNSVALLPANIVKNKDGEPVNIEHPLNFVLNMQPNKKYTHFNFFKKMIEDVLLNGNAYAYIERDERLVVKALYYIEPQYVNPLIQKDGSVKYIVQGMNEAVDAVNMIHLYMHCDDQMHGISVIKYAVMTLEGAMDAESHSNSFFRSGANLSGVLKSNSVLDKDKREQLRDIWTSAFRKGSNNGVNVAILPQGIEFQPISVSPEDAQLLESRKFSVIEIARFFNISPIKLFDLQEVSYSSMESTQLSYLQDTIQPYTRMIEDEFNLKLFRPSEVGKVKVQFDYNKLYQTDRKSEAEYYRMLITNGLMSPNEARGKLGLPPIPAEQGGDEMFIQMSYTTMKNIKDGVLISQKQGQSDDIDNKVKGQNNTDNKE